MEGIPPTPALPPPPLLLWPTEGWRTGPRVEDAEAGAPTGGNSERVGMERVGIAPKPLLVLLLPARPAAAELPP